MSLQQSLDAFQAAWIETVLSLDAGCVLLLTRKVFCRPSHKSCLKLDGAERDLEDGFAGRPDNSLREIKRGGKKKIMKGFQVSAWNRL